MQKPAENKGKKPFVSRTKLASYIGINPYTFIDVFDLIRDVYYENAEKEGNSVVIKNNKLLEIYYKNPDSKKDIIVQFQSDNIEYVNGDNPGYSSIKLAKEEVENFLKLDQVMNNRSKKLVYNQEDKQETRNDRPVYRGKLPANYCGMTSAAKVLNISENVTPTVFEFVLKALDRAPKDAASFPVVYKGVKVELAVDKVKYFKPYNRPMSVGIEETELKKLKPFVVKLLPSSAEPEKTGNNIWAKKEDERKADKKKGFDVHSWCKK